MNTEFKKITSYEEGCKVLNKDPNQLPVVDHLEPEFAKDIMARYKLMVIILAINTLSKFKVDFNNPNQRKWYLWYWVDADAERPAGFGFSGTDTIFDRTLTAVGARLYVGSEAEALHMDKYFQPLYKDMLI